MKKLRKLEELNLVDDFLANSLTSHAVYGEPAARCILECILGRKIGKIKVTPQRAVQGEDTDRHGIRMDVYLDEEDGELFDLEPDNNDGARTIFLYTKGTEGNPPENLRELLYYMEHTSKENAKTERLQRLHEMVTAVKNDGKVGLAYMKSYEIEQRRWKEGRAAGIAESILDLLDELGDIPDSLRETITSQKEEATLRVWHKLAAKAESIEEFIEKTR